MQAVTAAHGILQKTRWLWLCLAYAHLPTNRCRILFWFSFFFHFLFSLLRKCVSVAKAILVNVWDRYFCFHLFALNKILQSVFWRLTYYWGQTNEFVVPKLFHPTFYNIHGVFSLFKPEFVRFIRQIMLSHFHWRTSSSAFTLDSVTSVPQPQCC